MTVFFDIFCDVAIYDVAPFVANRGNARHCKCQIYSVEVLSLPEDGEPVPSEEKPESKTDGAEEPEVGKEEGESVDSKEHVEL